ncbi:dipeptidyl peptidase 4 omega [Lycorma delicatula]|uniref:dipeptidyl peptidase 4 omega n=1 Tax=Lycorma delicatula TaxID=130591 RepID=UPI003F515C87
MTGQQTRVNGSSTLEMGSSNQELLSGGKKGKLTIVVAGLVIVLALGILSFIIFNRTHAEPMANALTSDVRSIDLLEMLAGRYNPNRFNGSWVSDDEILYKDSSDNIVLYSVSKKSKKILVKNLSDIVQTAFSFELSADKRFLLVGHSYQKLYRHSYLAYYVVINLSTQTLINISDQQGTPRQIQLVVWSPVGNALAYVFMNDIYHWPTVELPMQEIRLTRNGRTYIIHNGVPDWVYEEEVFSSNSAMWFSNDGSKLAFVTFNDSTTPVMSIPYYGSPGNFAFQYTNMVNIRYPKPGRANPEVTLSVAYLGQPNMESGPSPRILSVPPPNDLLRMEPIISAVTWSGNHDLAVTWMNRVQNKARIIICPVDYQTCNTVLSVEESKGWVELFHAPLFSSDGRKMVLVYSSDQGGNAGKYRHILEVDLMSTPFKPVPLTHGRYSVSDVLGWDEANHEIYFLSNTETAFGQLRVNKVPDNLDSAPYDPVCVSCQIPTLDGKKCLYSGASFSKKASYHALTCAGPHVPEIRLFDKFGKEIITWEDNDELKEILEEVTLPLTKEFTIPVADGFEAVVKLLLPPNIDTSGQTKYPMLIQVYGGPDTNLVNERFTIDWNTYLAVNHSVIIGYIDARNSGMRGDKIRFAGYRNLGTVEVEDTIYVTKYLQDNLNYIDRNRSALWGWSYGGYTTVMTLANDTKDVFKCGISVAPVTDWIYYDSIYTERFMGLPTVDDNLSGYSRAAIFNKVENLRHKQFLLVHGTLDDNVHYQQSMMLAKILEQNDILFRQQNYPDEEHGLSGVRSHLYHTLEQFLNECFLLK